MDGEAISDEGVYGSGQNRISVDGGVGNLRIRFEDFDYKDAAKFVPIIPVRTKQFAMV